MADGKFEIVIQGEDQTGPANKSAIAGMRGVLKATDEASTKTTRRIADASKSASGSITKTFKTVEVATASALGSSGGVIDRLLSVGKAGSAMGMGMSAAAESGGVLSGSLGVLGVAAAGTAAAVVGVAYATDKLVGSWAKGIASTAQLADTIGVATQKLMAFQAAGERIGVDKDASAGAMAGLSGTLYNARWGRNTDALAILAAMRVKMQYDKNGNPDTTVMLPGIADALARQTPQGRLMAAQALGIPASALPLFSRGGKALSADMTDASKTAPIATPGQIALAREWRRKRVRAGQMAERAMMGAGGWAANASMPALDAANDIGSSLPTVLPRAADKIDRAADKMLRAVNGGGSSGGGGGSLPSGSFASRIEHLGEWFGRTPRQSAVSPAGAVGVMQLLPSTARRVAQANGIPWSDYAFRHDAGYNRRLGSLEAERLHQKYGDDVLAAIAYNAGEGVLDSRGYRDRSGRRHQSWLQRFGDPRQGQISDEEFIRRIPYAETRSYAERVAGAGPAEHVHVHHIHIDRRGVKVRTQTQGGKHARVSYALADPLN